MIYYAVKKPLSVLQKPKELVVEVLPQAVYMAEKDPGIDSIHKSYQQAFERAKFVHLFAYPNNKTRY